jgi:hypothetical protein
MQTQVSLALVSVNSPLPQLITTVIFQPELLSNIQQML